MQQQLLRIFVVNPPKPWSMDGRSGFSHSAECGLVDEKGEVLKVGVLRVKEAKQDLVKKLAPGYFAATFTLEPNPASRVIEAVVVDLVPLIKGADGFSLPARPKA